MLCRGLPLAVSWHSPDRIVGVSQCTLGRVAVHARPCCNARQAVSQRTPSRVATHIRPCHSARPAVSQLTSGRIARRVVAHTPSASYRGALMRRIAALACCIVTQSRPLNHDTIFVPRPTPSQAPRARAAARPCAPLSVSWPFSRPYRKRARPCRSRVLARNAHPCSPASCYVTVQFAIS